MIPGGCLCGKVRYRLLEEPHHRCDCHCIDCRRASGAPFVTWGTVATDRLAVDSGEVRDVQFAGRVRSFAGCCGTTLFFKDDATAQSVDIALATLDDPTPFPPDRAIWTEDRLPWVPLDHARRAWRRNTADSAEPPA